jgi:hypothetical protein
MNMHVPTLQRSLSDVVSEYEHKRSQAQAALAEFNAAGDALKMAATIAGTFGRTQIDTGHVYESVLSDSLLKSAWRHVYDGLNIERICSANDKRRFDQALEKPEPFTLENIRATFGQFILDPRGNILRGLAEVFCNLDPAYKSHDKVKIGVAGLPKRVIIRSVGNYGSYGRDQVVNILNALAAYQGKPLVEHDEVSALLSDECALLENGEKPYGYRGAMVKVTARGVRLRRFANGNGHLIFEPETLTEPSRNFTETFCRTRPKRSRKRLGQAPQFQKTFSITRPRRRWLRP